MTPTNPAESREDAIQRLRAFQIDAINGDEGRLADANVYLPLQDAVRTVLALLDSEGAVLARREGEGGVSNRDAAREALEQIAAQGADPKNRKRPEIFDWVVERARDALAEAGPRRPKGRCLGCRTSDWPYCKGCGADLTDEKPGGHFVVMDADGTVLDPPREGTFKLSDWPSVNQVVGLLRPAPTSELPNGLPNSPTQSGEAERLREALEGLVAPAEFFHSRMARRKSWGNGREYSRYTDLSAALTCARAALTPPPREEGAE